MESDAGDCADDASTSNVVVTVGPFGMVDVKVVELMVVSKALFETCFLKVANR